MQEQSSLHGVQEQRSLPDGESLHETERVVETVGRRSQPHVWGLSHLVRFAFPSPQDESHTENLGWLLDIQAGALCHDP